MNGVLEEQGEVWTHCCGRHSLLGWCSFEEQDLVQMSDFGEHELVQMNGFEELGHVQMNGVLEEESKV
jgi:hypothetical protein